MCFAHCTHIFPSNLYILWLQKMIPALVVNACRLGPVSKRMSLPLQVLVRHNNFSNCKNLLKFGYFYFRPTLAVIWLEELTDGVFWWQTFRKFTAWVTDDHWYHDIGSSKWKLFLDRCPKIPLLVGAWYNFPICSKFKFLEWFGQISGVGGWFWRCKCYLRDHIICISVFAKAKYHICLNSFYNWKNIQNIIWTRT